MSVLIKNSKKRYTNDDVDEESKAKAILELKKELIKGENSAKEKGYVEFSEVLKLLGVENE